MALLKKSAKRELENARKKASSGRKQNLRVAHTNFIYLSFFNPKVDIFFVTLNKLNILIKLQFTSYPHLLSCLFETYSFNINQ